MKKIRNIMHTVGGFTFAYGLARYTGLFNVDDYSTRFELFFLSVIALTIFTAFVGIFYEFIMKEIDNERQADMKDVVRTAVGGTIAGCITTFPFSLPLWITTAFVCLLALIYDICILVKKK